MAVPTKARFYDLIILLLCIFPREKKVLMSTKDTYKNVMAALFITA